MSNLNTEQLARMIVEVTKNTDLNDKQKIQVIDGMLQNYLKLDVTNKGYQFKDLIEAISKMDEFLMFNYNAKPNVLGRQLWTKVGGVPLSITFDEKVEDLEKAYLFCLEDCYGIFLDDNSFTIATAIMEKHLASSWEFERGMYGFRKFGLIDCVKNNQLKYVKCGIMNFEFPSYFIREEGIETLDDGRTFYFIKLRNLLSLTRFGKKINNDENSITYGNSISRELIELTIKTVNDYLKKHPLFVEQAVLKRVRKPNQ